MAGMSRRHRELVESELRECVERIGELMVATGAASIGIQLARPLHRPGVILVRASAYGRQPVGSGLLEPDVRIAEELE